MNRLGLTDLIIVMKMSQPIKWRNFSVVIDSGNLIIYLFNKKKPKI